MEDNLMRLVARAEQAETLLDVTKTILANEKYPDVDLLRLILGVKTKDADD